MPRKPQPWFRFYVEAFPDRKLRRVPPAQRWVWVAILGAARESPQPGLLLVADGLPMTEAELADYAGVKTREVSQAVAAFRDMQMITVNGHGLISVINWPNRQFESDNVAARTAAYRERHDEPM